MRDAHLTRTWDDAVEQLDRCRTVLEPRLAMLRLLVVDGLAGTSYDGTGRGGNESTPTERAALIHDRAHRDLRRLAALAVMLGRIADEAVALLSHYAPGDAVQLELDGIERLPAGTGRCQRCDVWCSGVSDTNDRLRSGLCHRCHTAWDRAGKPERAPWIAEHRRLMDQSQPA